ncbi:MAG TPA: CHAT domain-containing tetratricopeptide repeat protein, partial [Pyrinomonadaceae bacterium]|nr:CHAT domain-containing tetratricopeptide repeat protein [Pyrinomonadaceae bacterium]
NNLGEIYYFQGEHQRALDTLQQALSLWPDKTWRGRARTLINIGYANFDLRNMDRALAFYDQALSQSRADHNRRAEALALTALGGVYAYQGNRQTAVASHNQAEAIFRAIGDRNGEAVALNGLGYVYRNLAEYQKSLDCYLQALRLFQVLGNRDYANFTLTRVGKAYQGLGDQTKALEYYQQAAERTVTYSQTRAQALSSIGTVFEAMHKPRKALVYYQQSLALFRAMEDKMGEASVLNSVGQVYTSFGERFVALKSYRQALAISQKVRDRRAEVSVLLNIAHTYRDAADYSEALQTIERSLSIIESLRTEAASASLRASYFASVRDHYELYIDILMQLHKSQPAGHFAEQAFTASEKARARSLLESLEEAHADIRQGVESTLLEQGWALQQELNNKAERHMQLVAAKKIEEAGELAKEIDRLSAQYDQVEVQIKLKSPRYAALTQSQPLSLTEIQEQVLDDDSLLLEYVLGDERSYVWAVTRTEVSTFELPARAKIEEAAIRFQRFLTANQPVPGETFEQTQDRVREAGAHISAEAASFSQLVLGPVVTKLGRKRLIIVPDGTLQYIPFQALVVPGTANGNAAPTQSNAAIGNDELIPLMVDHEIVNEASASALALVLKETTQRKQAPHTIAVLANPVFEGDDPRIKSKSSSETQTARLPQDTQVREVLRDAGFGEGVRIPSLPASREEANAIMAVVPWRTGFKAEGFEASRATITQPELSQYRIVHFATHGFVDYKHPELSGLVLSLFDENGNPQNGFLRLHDIYNLKLSADLVVLSACNTGLGKDVKGEGLIGLTRGFMYAGAGGVVASLWKVDDEATAELMTYFYEGMFKRGLTPAAALREAQLALWRQKRWHTPYFWAAFVIQGQYNQHLNSPSRLTPARRVVALGILLGGLSWGLFFLLRRRRRRNL